MGMLSPNQGVVLEFSKHIPEHLTHHGEMGFLVWGPFDFLVAYTITSLSSYQHSSFEKSQSYNDHFIAERQSIYLYKENLIIEGKTSNRVDWIFSNSLSNRLPLLVMSLVTTNNIIKVETELHKVVPRAECEFEIYKTLGTESCVIIFRCKSYEKVLRCIVALNGFCKNTYSISGVQSHPSYSSNRTDNGFRFGKANSLPEETLVAIEYLLKNGKSKVNRTTKVAKDIIDSIDRFCTKYPTKSEKLEYELYYQLGHYDMELILRGRLGRVLDIMLNIDYGLTNVNSKFYSENIVESRTTWKTLRDKSKE